MKPTEPEADEPFADLLLVCDAALAARIEPVVDSGGDSVCAAELQPRLQRGIACLRRLRRHFPASSGAMVDYEATPCLATPRPLPCRRLGLRWDAFNSCVNTVVADSAWSFLPTIRSWAVRSR